MVTAEIPGYDISTPFKSQQLHQQNRMDSFSFDGVEESLKKRYWGRVVVEGDIGNGSATSADHG